MSARPAPAGVPRRLIDAQPPLGAKERGALVDLVMRLCAVDSTTGREALLADVLEPLLRERGYVVGSHEVAPGEGRRNVVALRPGACGGRCRVVLTTHMDTVPPYLPPRLAGDRIFGRGACDAKGPLAAMILAGDRLAAAGVGDFGLLFVCSEETDSLGAKTAAAGALGFHPAYFIDGEPTDNVLVRGSKGLWRVVLRAEGVLGHSAYPDVGRSAIHQLVGDLARVLAAPLPAGELGSTTVNVGIIGGGRAANVIADEARAELLFRLGTSTARVRAALLPLLSPTTFVEDYGGNEPQDMLVPEGVASQVVAFGTDVPHLAPLAPSALVGPGSILDAHTAHESVAIAELEDAVRLYTALATRGAFPHVA